MSLNMEKSSWCLTKSFGPTDEHSRHWKVSECYWRRKITITNLVAYNLDPPARCVGAAVAQELWE